tara:strand:- start:47 stop:424 length:378 start_codon:yes stop_codon:yes gene_type:complete
MKVVFKTSNLNNPLELFTGQGINTYNSSLQKLVLKRLRICSNSDVFLDVYIQATDASNNNRTVRHLAKSTPVVSGDNVDMFLNEVSVTNEYSVFISKVSGDSCVVDAYFEYEEVDDNPFVRSYTI